MSDYRSGMSPLADQVLEDAIRVYLREGYYLVDWGEDWAMMNRPARMDGCLVLFFPLVALFSQGRDQIVRIEVMFDGQVVETRL